MSQEEKTALLDNSEKKSLLKRNSSQVRIAEQFFFFPLEGLFY
jgi:hypothetical protein